MSEIQAGAVCLILGLVTMVNWWFAMFSDHWYGDLGRSFGEDGFNVGRNTISLVLPAVGMALLVGGFGMLLYPSGVDGSVLSKVLVVTASVCLIVAVLGLIPFRLPAPMYPEWQLEKRRARAEAAAREAGIEDEPVRSAGRYAAEPRKRPSGRPGRHVK